jgi:hypothetical protein
MISSVAGLTTAIASLPVDGTHAPSMYSVGALVHGASWSSAGAGRWERRRRRDAAGVLGVEMVAELLLAEEPQLALGTLTHCHDRLLP